MSVMPLPLAAVAGTAERGPQPGMLALRPYQHEAIAAIGAREYRRQIVALPTGTGKTVVFAHLIAGACARGERAIVLVHRDELVGQTLDKLRAVAPGLEVGVVKAERDEARAVVVVASVQTLARVRRRTRLVPDFALVIVDESHHAAAPSWRAILDYLGCFEVAGPLTVGFTATPERADGQSLAEVFEGIVYRQDILSMIREGYLCDVRGVRITLSADLDRVHSRGGDFIEGELAEEMTRANAPAQIAAGYVEHAAGRKALAFVPSVVLAEQTADVFCGAGVAAAPLSAHTPLAQRRALLADLRAGRVQVVTNCGVLTEGFDEPSVDCLLLGRPTHSRPLYVQMIGRVLRTFPGKECAVVLDFVGASSRHQLLTLASLLPVHGARSVKQTECDVERERAAMVASTPQSPATHEGTLVGEAFDLLGRATLHWARGYGRATGLHVLALPDKGGLLLAPTSDGDGAYEVLRMQDADIVEQLAAALPLEWAQGTAEDWARAHHLEGLALRGAQWRARPASEKTLWQWDRVGKRRPVGITQGKASDALVLADALRALVRRRAHAANATWQQLQAHDDVIGEPADDVIASFAAAGPGGGAL